MPTSNYDDAVMNALRKRLWSAAFKFASELHEENDSLS